MALTTGVTPHAVAVALGRPDPPAGSTVELQWQMWIADALMLIQMRVDSITPTPAIDPARLDYVIREAVVAHVRRPDDSAQVTVTVDDSTTSKLYRSSAGRVVIIDDWWNLLGLSPSAGKAFELDTLPTDFPSGECGGDYWWTSTTDWVTS